MKQLENKILKDLYESVDGLYAFTVYSRYKIAPKDLFLFIDKYLKKNIITYENDKIRLTNSGRDNIFSTVLHNKKSSGKFNNLPQNYVGNKMEKNFPYLPNLQYLSPEIISIEGRQ